MKNVITCIAIWQLMAVAAASAKTLTLDETPASVKEWGYRPAERAVLEVNSPAFCWRPQKGIASWEVQCARDNDFKAAEYEMTGIVWNVHRPSRVLPPGSYTWRYRGSDGGKAKTNWSRPRTFVISKDAVSMSMSPREELLGRIPKTHPRLFVRPDDRPRLRELAKGPLKEQFEGLVARCEKLLSDPPPTAEPKKYPPKMKRKSKEWKKLWWDNRRCTIAALDGAATLAFTRLLGGKEEYGQLSKRILLDCAKWDPVGATGYRYNDEAGMPYAYHFSRTYTFVNDLLTDEERESCRKRRV